MRLRSSFGEIVRGRCGSTNQCAYCARLAAVENAELLALDAAAGSAPAMWAVLTTSLSTLDTRRFYKSRELVLRALRRRWPGTEYAALVEFTTGYGPRSGGRRRPHWNLLLKGIAADELEDAAAVIRRVWCSRESARPEAQHVGLVGEAGGLMRYLALHFQKESQQPPAGWRGHRFVTSRGYLAGTTPERRAAARESLAFKRELWRALKRGLTGLDAEFAAREARVIAAATSWCLIDLAACARRVDHPDGDGQEQRSGRPGREASTVTIRSPKPEVRAPRPPAVERPPQPAACRPDAVVRRQPCPAPAVLPTACVGRRAGRTADEGAARSP